MPCSLGADLSQGDDFCAFTFLFPLPNGSFGIKTRNYITSTTLMKLPAAMRIKYDQFMAEGSLIVLEGAVLNMMDVYEDLDNHIQECGYDVRCLGFDPYNAKEFVARWESENGPFGIEKVIQGAKTESVPLGELKKLSEERMLIFDEDLMTFAMGNCITLEDTNGNRKLFFETIHDMSIPDEVLFKTSFEIEIGGMPCKYAWGGVHGSLTGYYEEATEDRVIQNRDVSSLYPSLIEIYKYLSRNVPDPELFYAIKRDRIQAKHNGDKQTAKDLKLPLNTVSGAQENRYNDLYDPLPTRSLRISGQLFLTVLTMRLLNACKTIKLLNLNTDGLMYSIDKSELALVDEIAHAWEAETKFELEVDDVQKVWIKDVNNLLMIKTDGEVKTVGGYLNYGVSVKGAWAINNNMVIVKKALIEYFVHGTPVEETINGSTDIFDFQLIAKAGAKYREAYHIVDGEQVPVQKVNRVYATADERYGKLFKVKAETDATAKIEMLPDHCIIDNDNHLTIDDVDRTFYIEMAKKRINDFLGIKPEKKKGGKRKMATTAKKETVTLNVYQKLLKAREMFLQADVQKTGKNMHLSFKYFELDDIVPTATRIFSEVGLIPIVNFTSDVATMKIVNIDNPDEEYIPFVAPFNQIAPIISNAGKQATNEMQALGSSITYMRRYLYMIALDICESDSIDSDIGKPTPALVSALKAPPATPEQRQEVKQELTAPQDNATPLQIKGLKAVLKKLKDADPTKEEMIAQIAVQTEGFTSISKSDCETLIQKITAMLEGGNE